jgi:uncharacterized membrane protein YqjE
MESMTLPFRERKLEIFAYAFFAAVNLSIVVMAGLVAYRAIGIYGDSRIAALLLASVTLLSLGIVAFTLRLYQKMHRRR